MNYAKSSFILTASLLLLPFVSAFGQAQVKEPGTFDPKTESAHEASTQEALPLNALPSLDAKAVKAAGRIVVPASSVELPADKGLRAHTHMRVFVPPGHGALSTGADGAVVTDLSSAASITPNNTFAENPGSLACVDGVIPAYSGCTYSGGFSLHPVGGGGAVVIVDAYHNPDAASDLATFDAEWGLPAVNFLQVYCTGSTGTCNSTNTPPAVNTGWDLEIALDIEYAHAMAPSAKIILVEAASNSYADLTWAEAWGGYYADIYGGGEVSNSWGGSEFSGETSDDYFFNNYSGNYHPVVYLASGGDTGTIEYPAASPYVISVGGTTINRDSSGNYLNQTCWSGTGLGTSAYETAPYAQSSIAGLSGTMRQTNDLSSDADPNSGVWVYDGENGGWQVVGGTSVAAPTVAGILNNSANVMTSSNLEQDLIYSEFAGRKSYGSYWYDVTPAGYDQCTGIGVPKNLNGK